MTAQQARTRRGFTLIELMIVVAIIGLLAAIAVPSFRNYQFGSKRAEAYANMGALVKTQKSFYAEAGAYVGVPIAEPGFTQASVPNGAKRSSDELDVAFAEVGWAAVGDVFYDYDSVSSGTSNGADHPLCGCPTCLTVTAYGDVDDDGNPAMIVYMQPDELGNSCTTGLFNLGPPLDPGGNPIFNEIVRMPLGVADDY